MLRLCYPQSPDTPVGCNRDKSFQSTPVPTCLHSAVENLNCAIHGLSKPDLVLTLQEEKTDTRNNGGYKR